MIDIARVNWRVNWLIMENTGHTLSISPTAEEVLLPARQAEGRGFRAWLHLGDDKPEQVLSPHL